MTSVERDRGEKEGVRGSARDGREKKGKKEGGKKFHGNGEVEARLLPRL